MSLLTPYHQWLWYAGCFTCATTIVVAAAAGHKNEWTPQKKDSQNKAVTLGLISGVGMLLSSLVTKSYLPGTLLLTGTGLFCGPIYYKNFTDDTSLSKLTPIGGSAMIAAWVLLAIM
jgi:uncharacterized membrane protein YgdD (TMEM256/DUF423 family)